MKVRLRENLDYRKLLTYKKADVQGLNLTRSGSCASGLIAVETISQCLYSLVRTTESVLPSLKRVLLTLLYFY